MPTYDEIKHLLWHFSDDIRDLIEDRFKEKLLYKELNDVLCEISDKELEYSDILCGFYGKENIYADEESGE